MYILINYVVFVKSNIFNVKTSHLSTTLYYKLVSTHKFLLYEYANISYSEEIVKIQGH